MNKKAAVFLLGSISAFLTLEAVLFLISSPWFYPRRHAPTGSGERGKTILCIGDSFVRGLGAPEGKSFPSQLDSLLKRNGYTGWNVVNTGTPGENTTQIRNRLRADAELLRPDIIVFLGGMINEGNYYGYFSYAHKKTFPGKCGDLIMRVRTVKLAGILISGMRKRVRPESAAGFYGSVPDGDVPGDPWFQQKLEEVRELQRTGGYGKAVGILLALDEASPGSFLVNRLLGDAYERSGLPEKAVLRYERALAVKEDIGTAWELGRIYDLRLRNYRAAFKTWSRSVESDPVPAGRRNYCFEGLFALLMNKDAASLHPEIKIFLTEILSKMPEDSRAFISEALTYGARSSVNNWKRSDINEIIDIAERYRSRFLLLNYPEISPGGPLVEDIAQKRNVPLVDNRRSFDELLMRHMRHELFAADNSHCNERGYGVIARNVYDELKKLGLLDKTDPGAGRPVAGRGQRAFSGPGR